MKSTILLLFEIIAVLKWIRFTSLRDTLYNCTSGPVEFNFKTKSSLAPTRTNLFEFNLSFVCLCET